MHAVVQSLIIWTVHLVSSLGYYGIFIGMTVESACIPLPSEAIMAFAGYLTYKGVLQFWPAVIIGTLGNVVGSIIAYYVGIRGGRPFLERYGRAIWFSHKHLDVAEKWFLRYGDWSVFFGRLLPVIRTFISLPAGIFRMRFGPFVLFTAVGSLPWSFLLVYVGLKLGPRWDSVETNFRPLTYVFLALIIILIIWFLRKNRDKKL